MNLWNELTSKSYVFLLILFRIGGIFITAPFFSHKTIPVKVKIVFAFMIAWIVYSMHAQAGNVQITTVLGLGLAIAKETAIGIIIGYGANVLFETVQLAGMFIGRQMGFGFARVVDMTSNNQAVLIGILLNIVAMLIFLSINGHHLIIKALVQSFRIIPLNGLSFDPEFPHKLIKVVGRIFPEAIKISAPALSASILTTVALGLMARSVPQMNVFFCWAATQDYGWCCFRDA